MLRTDKNMNISGFTSIPARLGSIMRILPLVSAVLMALLCTPAHAEMIDGIVAVVDDKVIMHSDLVKKMHDLGAKNYDSSTATQVLQLMVEDAIVDKVYRSLGLPQVELSRAEEAAKSMNIDVASAQSMIKKSTLMDLMVKSRVVVTETMVQDYYNSHPKEYSGADSLHIKQILMKNDPVKADKAIADIRSGRPFDEAAKDYAEKVAGSNPDIGWIRIDELASEARNVLEHAKPGDIVGPISLGENILIYQVLERGVSGGKPLDEVRSEIVEILQMKHQKEAFDHWLKMIIADHFVGIYM
ncbi:MAG: peptidyl-prolyl cis-trans isomerase [Desulfomonilia bacterium]